MGRLALCWLACAACTFHRDATHGPRDAVAMPDAAPDAPPDAAPTCMQRWLAGTPRFAPATAIAEINSPMYDRDPFLAPDELTIYFSSARGTALGGADEWVATRSAIDQPFTTPVLFPPATTLGFDSKISITADQLLFVLATDQNGGHGGADVWQSQRTASATSWGTLDESHEGTIDDTGNQLDPQISVDGLRLYYSAGSPQAVVLSSRANTGQDFGAPSPIAEIASSVGQADPTISPDERVIVFSSQRTDAGFAGTNLWYATRADATQPFGTPHPVPDVNTAADEGDGHLSADGCRLYFASDAPGNYDIYVAAMM